MGSKQEKWCTVLLHLKKLEVAPHTQKNGDESIFRPGQIDEDLGGDSEDLILNNKRKKKKKVTPLFSHTNRKKRVVSEPPGIDEEQKGCCQPPRDAFQKNILSLTTLEIFQLIVVLRDSSSEMFSNWASCLSPWFAPEGTVR